MLSMPVRARALVAVAGLAILAGCGDDDASPSGAPQAATRPDPRIVDALPDAFDPGSPAAPGTFVGEVGSGATYIGIVRRGDDAVVYLCDGRGGDWLGARVRDGRILVRSASGAIVDAKAGDDVIRGTVTRDGRREAFTARPASGDAGVFVAEDPALPGYTRRWIVLADGIRGVSQPGNRPGSTTVKDGTSNTFLVGERDSTTPRPPAPPPPPPSTTTRTPVQPPPPAPAPSTTSTAPPPGAPQTGNTTATAPTIPSSPPATTTRTTTTTAPPPSGGGSTPPPSQTVTTTVTATTPPPPPDGAPPPFQPGASPANGVAAGTGAPAGPPAPAAANCPTAAACAATPTAEPSKPKPKPTGKGKGRKRGSRFHGGRFFACRRLAVLQATLRPAARRGNRAAKRQLRALRAQSRARGCVRRR